MTSSPQCAKRWSAATKSKSDATATSARSGVDNSTTDRHRHALRARKPRRRHENTKERKSCLKQQECAVDPFWWTPISAHNARRSPRWLDDGVFDMLRVKAEAIRWARWRVRVTTETDPAPRAGKLRRQRGGRALFRTLTLDRNQPVWRSRALAIARIGAYLDGYYNTRRLQKTKPNLAITLFRAFVLPSCFRARRT
jgi:hypothetical protein